MEVKTYEDAKKASQKTGFTVQKIASAFVTKVTDHDLSKKLAEAVSAKDVGLMWEVASDAPDESDVKADALKEINEYYVEKLAKAVKAKDVGSMHNVYRQSPDGSDVEIEAIREIVLLMD